MEDEKFAELKARRDGLLAVKIMVIILLALSTATSLTTLISSYGDISKSQTNESNLQVKLDSSARASYPRSLVDSNFLFVCTERTSVCCKFSVYDTPYCLNGVDELKPFDVLYFFGSKYDIGDKLMLIKVE